MGQVNNAVGPTSIDGSFFLVHLGRGVDLQRQPWLMLQKQVASASNCPAHGPQAINLYAPAVVQSASSLPADSLPSRSCC